MDCSDTTNARAFTAFRRNCAAYPRHGTVRHSASSVACPTLNVQTRPVFFSLFQLRTPLRGLLPPCRSFGARSQSQTRRLWRCKRRCVHVGCASLPCRALLARPAAMSCGVQRAACVGLTAPRAAMSGGTARASLAAHPAVNCAALRSPARRAPGPGCLADSRHACFAPHSA